MIKGFLAKVVETSDITLSSVEQVETIQKTFTREIACNQQAIILLSVRKISKLYDSFLVRRRLSDVDSGSNDGR